MEQEAPNESIEGLTEFIWALRLSLQPRWIILPLPQILPPDLQLEVSRHLFVKDCLALRSTSRCLRALASLSGVWALIAPREWARVNALSHTQARGLGDDVLLPSCKGASLADVCTRMVRWPSHLSLGCSLDTISFAAVLEAAVANVGALAELGQFTNSTEVLLSADGASVEFSLPTWRRAPRPMSFVVADCAFPRMADGASTTAGQQLVLVGAHQRLRVVRHNLHKLGHDGAHLEEEG